MRQILQTLPLMKKKFITLSKPVFSVNLFFIHLFGCYRNKPICSYPQYATLTAMDNADSAIHAPVNNQVIAKALALELYIRDSFYQCKNTYPYSLLMRFMLKPLIKIR